MNAVGFQKDIPAALGVAAGVLIAQLLAMRAGLPIIGWFIGGSIIGLSLGLRPCIPKEETSRLRLLASVILSGIAATVAYNLASLW